jgi:serine/threonine-protein kinase RsbW
MSVTPVFFLREEGQLMAVQDFGSNGDRPIKGAEPGPASNHFELVVRAEAERLADLREASRVFAAKHGVAHPERVALAVTEACTNVILHAYRNGPPGDVHLVADRYDDRVVFVVDDDGHGFAPRADGSGLGAGLPMMASVSDHVLIGEGDGGGTHAEITFAIGSAG